MTCTDCFEHATTVEASVSAENCTCNQGFHKQIVGLVREGKCIDVDECTLIPNVCKDKLLTCMNTVGSYLCLSSNLSNIAKCDGPIPNSCDTAGGNLIWIKMPGILDGPLFSVKMDQLILQAQYDGSYISVICPPSDSVGNKISYVLRSNLSVYCTFPFMYTPAPAKVTPRIVPLSGGRIMIQLHYFWEYLNSKSRNCRVMYGTVPGELFLFDGKNDNIFTVAPPSDVEKTVPLQLQCSDLKEWNDLHVYLEYVASSIPSINGAGKCMRFQRCELSIGLTNPPRAINGPQDLDLSVLDAQFSDYDNEMKSVYITQVRLGLRSKVFS